MRILTFDQTQTGGESSQCRRRLGLALLLVGIGLFIRVYHFISDPSIWFDEAAVMVNVLDKSYAELLGPLEHAANGPILFLWLEKWLVTWLGDHPWVWRAPALAASCLSLVLFFVVARRVLPTGSLVWAVGFFAFSDQLLWHTVEVRPYTIDTLVAVGVLAVWLWTDAWQLRNRILLFAILSPLLFCLSYPAMFICAGPALLLLRDTCKSRCWRTVLAYALYLGAMAATGVWLMYGPIRAQHEGMKAYGFEWISQMPDWTHAGKALLWPATAVWEVLRYCFRPTGGLLMGFAALGAIGMARNGQRRLAALVLAPFFGAMAAACLHRYPCGGARPMLFMTAGAALLIGYSIPAVLQWCLAFEDSKPSIAGFGYRRWCSGFAGIAILLVALAPMGLGLYRTTVPWARFECRGAAEYVLSHRRATDFVAININAWDQFYFYRRLDPRWRCNFETLGDTAPRCWATVNLSLTEDADLDSKLKVPSPWKVAERKQFSHVTVYLLERVAS